MLTTTVVGSYPQPDWLVDRALLAKGVPRVRMQSMWRIPEPFLEQAQDDATIVAIRDMERAGIDIVTDGEIRRESYSNRFATALDGVDITNPGHLHNGTPVPRVVGKIQRTRPVELRDMQFLRRNTDRPAKITLPGPFTMAQQARNEFYPDVEALAMDFAVAVNAELHDLQAAGARGHHGADRRAPVLRLRGGREDAEADGLRVPAAAGRLNRAADLDRGSAAEARSRDPERARRQDDHARRDRSQRSERRDA